MESIAREIVVKNSYGRWDIMNKVLDPSRRGNPLLQEAVREFEKNESFAIASVAMCCVKF